METLATSNDAIAASLNFLVEVIEVELSQDTQKLYSGHISLAKSQISQLRGIAVMEEKEIESEYMEP